MCVPRVRLCQYSLLVPLYVTSLWLCTVGSSPSASALCPQSFCAFFIFYLLAAALPWPCVMPSLPWSCPAPDPTLLEIGPFPCILAALMRFWLLGCTEPVTPSATCRVCACPIVPPNRLVSGLCGALPAASVCDPDGSIAGVLLEIAVASPDMFTVRDTVSWSGNG